MTIIAALSTWIKTNTDLKDKPVWVDYLGPEPAEYSINPMPGNKVLETYINGASRRAYPFSFNAMAPTDSDMERLANIGFFETLSDWMETQTEAGNLPTLGTGKTAESVQADNWGYLFEEGESGTGVYQVQCTLTYYQALEEPETEPEPEPEIA